MAHGSRVAAAGQPAGAAQVCGQCSGDVRSRRGADAPRHQPASAGVVWQQADEGAGILVLAGGDAMRSGAAPEWLPCQHGRQHRGGEGGSGRLQCGCRSLRGLVPCCTSSATARGAGHVWQPCCVQGTCHLNVLRWHRRRRCTRAGTGIGQLHPQRTLQLPFQVRSDAASC